jgi:hypothetical protein
MLQTPAGSTITPVAVTRPSVAANASHALFCRMKDKWMSRTLIDDKQPELGSWLAESDAVSCGIEYRICRSAAMQLPPAERMRCKWITFSISEWSIKWCNISRHTIYPCTGSQGFKQQRHSTVVWTLLCFVPPADFKQVLNHE